MVRPATPPALRGPPWAPADPPAGPPADTDEADDTDEHYVPPPPPPLPHLDPVAKGAWTALFGGPAYLLVATLVGWTVAGWTALLASRRSSGDSWCWYCASAMGRRAARDPTTALCSRL